MAKRPVGNEVLERPLQVTAERLISLGLTCRSYESPHLLSNFVKSLIDPCAVRCEAGGQVIRFLGDGDERRKEVEGSPRRRRERVLVVGAPTARTSTHFNSESPLTMLTRTRATQTAWTFVRNLEPLLLSRN
jgi:hypothetical protein